MAILWGPGARWAHGGPMTPQKTIDMVLGEVTKYVRSSNAALLVVEHDITRAKMMADRLLVIDDGRINPFITDDGPGACVTFKLFK